jgi:hypothetical protein
MEMRTPDRELIQTILQEINLCRNEGVIPVDNDHLKHLCEEGEILEYLLLIRDEGLIGGDLVTRGVNYTPHRMTNIRLTYLGIKLLRP